MIAADSNKVVLRKVSVIADKNFIETSFVSKTDACVFFPKVRNIYIYMQMFLSVSSYLVYSVISIIYDMYLFINLYVYIYMYIYLYLDRCLGRT